MRLRLNVVLAPVLLAACGGAGAEAGDDGLTMGTGGFGADVSVLTGGVTSTGGADAAVTGGNGGATSSSGGMTTLSGGGGGLSSGGLSSGGLSGSSGGLPVTGGQMGMGAQGTTGGRDGAGGFQASGGTVSGGAPASGSGGDSAVGGTSSGGAEAGACEFSGHVEYQLSGAQSWPQDVVELITAAMDEGTYYYNCYADLSKMITVRYNVGVPTAEANVDGQLSFGSNHAYMVTATAMHEIGHTLGVGYSPWTELTENQVWTGPAVVALMTSLPAEQRDPDMYSQRDYITADSQHFWPYGLNQASEHQSDWSLINHVRIVAAMQLDKQAFRDGTL